MDTSSFFQYPGADASGQQNALVFLERASQSEWDFLLQQMELCCFGAGEELIRIGQQDNAIYIVKTGELEVLIPAARGHMRRLTRLETGMVFGEQAFLDRQPRSATVRALSDVEVYRISTETFSRIAQQHAALGQKILIDLGRILSQRLREATRLLGGVTG